MAPASLSLRALRRGMRRLADGSTFTRDEALLVKVAGGQRAMIVKADVRLRFSSFLADRI